MERRFALRLKLHKVKGSVVHHCALFQRVLAQQGIAAQVIKGLCVVPQTREICEHFWVRSDDEGLDFDVGYAVGCLHSPELASVTTILLTESPDGFAKPDTDPENVRLFELYQKDPKTFWAEAPAEVRNFNVTQSKWQ